MKTKSIFLLVFLLLIFFLRSIGQINAYAAVTGISGTTISLSGLNQTYHTFNNGDQIIIMQMQDNIAGANTTNTSSFGALTTIASAGMYEVATISSVAGLPASLTITSVPSNTYNFGANSSVQIISFRKYGSPDYTTTASISALAWNGTIGGVVAMQVAGTLTVAYPITADGSGFRGGYASANYEASCEPTVYATNSYNYAAKGEGIQANSTGLYYGRSRLGNGAGGGSDDNGGGGGGANYSSGGAGGYGWTCSASPSGGFGGDSLGTFISKYRIFMGGGGGGGQQNNSAGSSGASGGGIILLKANVLTTTCSGSISISANGNTAANSDNDGSGGAGAGGSVVMTINTFNVPPGCPLNVSSNGGNGGNVMNSGAHGGGGGGGQGAVIYSGAIPVTNVNTTAANGSGGTNNSPSTSTASGGSGTDNSGVIPNAGSVLLPVLLTDFIAQVQDDDILLTWNTDREQGNEYFNVERSIDGNRFTTIGVVQGAGNGGSPRSCSYTDLSPNPGKNSYRLQLVDKDGLASYSGILAVNLTQGSKGIAVFPNPVTDQFTVQFKAGYDTFYALSLIDQSGRTVLTRNVLPAGGQIHLVIDKRLTSGVYVLRLSNPQETIVSSILVR